MDSKLKEKIDRAPQSPGVYLFKNADQKVLYVGKALRLRDRLKAYVHPERDTRPSIFLLMPQVSEVEWLLTDTEKEALLLESSLIKTHHPRYNISLRDDKSYVSLGLTKHFFPRLHITRKITKDGSEYFGPFSSAGDLRQTLTLVQKIFKVRDCTDSFFANRSRPCLRYQIKRCTAPCVGYVTEAQYSEQVREAKQFLLGDTDQLVEHLQGEMSALAKSQQYETAAVLRDRMLAVMGTLEAQKVESREHEMNVDAVGMAGDQEATLVKVLKIRHGRLVGADEFFVEEPIQAASEINRAFLQQYYLADFTFHEVPPQLLLSHNVVDRKSFEELLSERAHRKVKLHHPKRGWAAKLLNLAERNAATALGDRKRKSERSQKALAELERKLNLRHFPRRIEGYDISTFHGAEPVGSRVVFIDGEPDKSQYRHYNIRTVKGSNDFAMLKEMFQRRFAKLTDENRPDLVLVDGGRGQLKQVINVLAELGIDGLDLASIAKEKELLSKSGKTYAPERLFLPGQRNPIVFPSSSALLQLLQRVRDEAHRFGITRHRKARNKATLQSMLRRIPDVGPKRQRILLKSFGSFEKIRTASVEDLAGVKGITEKSAQSIHQFFHSKDSTEE